MVLGTDHAEIGALILSKWSLPIDIVNAVRWHHSPERIENSNIKSDIVYLSNQMCQSNTNKNIANGHFALPSSMVLQRLGIKFDQYKAMAKKANLWMEKLSGELSFD
jgi:HD-like signal output (HDOD) protein